MIPLFAVRNGPLLLKDNHSLKALGEMELTFLKETGFITLRFFYLKGTIII